MCRNGQAKSTHWKVDFAYGLVVRMVKLSTPFIVHYSVVSHIVMLEINWYHLSRWSGKWSLSRRILTGYLHSIALLARSWQVTTVAVYNVRFRLALADHDILLSGNAVQWIIWAIPKQLTTAHRSFPSALITYTRSAHDFLISIPWKRVERRSTQMSMGVNHRLLLVPYEPIVYAHY